MVTPYVLCPWLYWVSPSSCYPASRSLNALYGNFALANGGTRLIINSSVSVVGIPSGMGEGILSASRLECHTCHRIVCYGADRPGNLLTCGKRSARRCHGASTLQTSKDARPTIIDAWSRCGRVVTRTGANGRSCSGGLGGVSPPRRSRRGRGSCLLALRDCRIMLIRSAPLVSIAGSSRAEQVLITWRESSIISRWDQRALR